jgi:predicted homoserine dehydrogenase-like protein
MGNLIASIKCRGEVTGQCKTFRADVVATARRDLNAGELLDGEGGFMVYRKLMTAEYSVRIEGLLIGLPHGLALKRRFEIAQKLSWQNIEYEVTSQPQKTRKERERIFRAKGWNFTEQWAYVISSVDIELCLY